MITNFYADFAFPLTKTDILVGTNYGPLFLDEDDCKQFNFDQNWLIENIDTQAAQDLLRDIKIYYIERAKQLRKDGELR